jgi:hypothetical protein
VGSGVLCFLMFPLGCGCVLIVEGEGGEEGFERHCAEVHDSVVMLESGDEGLECGKVREGGLLFEVMHLILCYCYFNYHSHPSSINSQR